MPMLSSPMSAVEVAGSAGSAPASSLAPVCWQPQPLPHPRPGGMASSARVRAVLSRRVRRRASACLILVVLQAALLLSFKGGVAEASVLTTIWPAILLPLLKAGGTGEIGSELREARRQWSDLDEQWRCLARDPQAAARSGEWAALRSRAASLRPRVAQLMVDAERLRHGGGPPLRL